MSALRCALSFVPVVGPIVGGLDALSKGDRASAAVEAGGLVLDCIACGQARAAAALGRKAAGGGIRRAAARLLGAGRVALKSTLKQKLKRKAREASIKLGFAGARLLAEHRLGPAAAPRPFAEAGSADAQLHAAFAAAVYTPAGCRGDVCGVVGGAIVEYYYVDGDFHRGLWCAPALPHLVLAERGTSLASGQDLLQDACLAAGSALPAVSDRIGRAQAFLRSHARHLCDGRRWRVTLTGHSLGGTVAVHFGALPGSGVCAVHAFNPGGVPDLGRLAACGLAAPHVKIHRIIADAVSVAFMPGLRARQQRVYSKKAGRSLDNPHHMLHFL